MSNYNKKISHSQEYVCFLNFRKLTMLFNKLTASIIFARFVCSVNLFIATHYRLKCVICCAIDSTTSKDLCRT
jgi:hypothetical protein